jgi:hypothetical protein
MELALFKNRQFARKIRYNGHQFGQIRAIRAIAHLASRKAIGAAPASRHPR